MVSGTEITKIEQQKGKITAVCSEKEVFHSDIFLLANGVHSNLLAKQLGYDFPMTAGKGYSMTYNQPAFTFKQPVYLGDDSGGITPFSDALRIGGTMELSGLNTRLDKKRIQGIHLAAKKIL
ncbi:FAD-dependent oxidoreductase [Virgibacillus halophilus]|uniref:FAD-dependent oxidoreductase n=1 Tax=Tigheibacillus halophilus TaxID=361280 RepID=A0ABU5C2P8_9BACI|nr:FAD-dependent oxidoreductase [Virgibacillus halophilus]